MLNHSEPGASKRAVLLGSSGFIGRRLASLLQGSRVEVLGLSSRDLDLCKPESATVLATALRKGDALVMLSALTPEKGKDSGTLMRNLAMAQTVEEALKRSPVAHLVYLSSDGIFEDSMSPFRDDTPAFANNLYGHMHIGRELILKEACKREKIPLAVLRPCAVYGPGDTHNSYGPNRFLRTARSDGKIQLFGNGEETRDHLFVDDLCRVIQSSLERRSQGELNLATGRAVSFMELAGKIVRLVGSQVRIDRAPRGGPITHRHFDITGFAATFPSFRFTELDLGLARTHEETK